MPPIDLTAIKATELRRDDGLRVVVAEGPDYDALIAELSAARDRLALTELAQSACEDKTKEQGAYLRWANEAQSDDKRKQWHDASKIAEDSYAAWRAAMKEQDAQNT